MRRTTGTVARIMVQYRRSYFTIRTSFEILYSDRAHPMMRISLLLLRDRHILYQRRALAHLLIDEAVALFFHR